MNCEGSGRKFQTSSYRSFSEIEFPNSPNLVTSVTTKLAIHAKHNLFGGLLLIFT
jgi:hypothetical protein